jgi:RNA polymerase sigma-70 factor (ECF subfamily)
MLKGDPGDNHPDHERFMRLYSQHDVEIRRYVLTLVADRNVADDVMQETSVALWQKFDEYQDDRPFINWACRFAYYEVLKHRKRQKVQRRYFCEATVEALAEERLREHEDLLARRKALQTCLEKLPHADRDLVGLRYSTGATVADLAKEIDEPAKKIYRALERIRRALLNCVNQRLSAEGAS